MAFVHRKIYKQKPKQWGPFPAVQAGLFHNAERLGIDPASIALAIPIWNPGEQRDYSKNSFAIIQPISSPPAYEQNRLIFTGGVSRAPAIGHSSTSPNALTFTSEDDFTLMARGNLSNAGNGTYLLAQSDVLYLQKRSNNGTLRFQVPSGNYNYTDTMFPDEMANITGTYTANDLKLYLNSICLHTNNSTSTWSAQGYEWAFGSHQYNVENIPDGVSIYESIYIFSIVLSRRQIASLSDNPWQLWQPVPTVYYSFSAAPVTSNDQVYLIPGTGLYKDTEQDSVKLIPGGGLYKEQEGVSGSTLLPIKHKNTRTQHTNLRR